MGTRSLLTILHPRHLCQLSDTSLIAFDNLKDNLPEPASGVQTLRAGARNHAARSRNPSFSISCDTFSLLFALTIPATH